MSKILLNIVAVTKKEGLFKFLELSVESSVAFLHIYARGYIFILTDCFTIKVYEWVKSV